MTPDQRFGVATVLAGGILLTVAALMVALPLGVAVAGVLCAALGTVVLRGTKP